jgi:branched-chain amino acid aminotransferase
MTDPMTGPVDGPFAAGCAWVEGEYVPVHQARVPILDSGFTRSDLTYDVASVWDGLFFRLDDHLDRLLAGCRSLRIEPPASRSEIRDIMVETVRRSRLRNAYVEVVVTRGVPGPGERDPRRWTPRLYAYAIPYVWIIEPDRQEAGGCDLVVARDTFRIPPSSVEPTVKNFHWGDLTRALYEAYDRGGTSVVLTDARGLVTEGPGFNLFAVVDGQLRTPAHGVLHGVTRTTAIEIAREVGLDVAVADLTVDDLHRATEIFLTSTAGGIMPVASLDGAPLNEGTMGPVTAMVRATYWSLRKDPRYTLEVAYE